MHRVALKFIKLGLKIQFIKFHNILMTLPVHRHRWPSIFMNTGLYFFIHDCCGWLLWPQWYSTRFQHGYLHCSYVYQLYLCLPWCMAVFMLVFMFAFTCMLERLSSMWVGGTLSSSLKLVRGYGVKDTFPGCPEVYLGTTLGNIVIVCLFWRIFAAMYLEFKFKRYLMLVSNLPRCACMYVSVCTKY